MSFVQYVIQSFNSLGLLLDASVRVLESGNHSLISPSLRFHHLTPSPYGRLKPYQALY